MSASFEEKLATAMMAKLTGNALKSVDENMMSQSSSGPANRIDPSKFIGSNTPQHNPAHQQHIIDQLNAEAMRAYPLPEQVHVASAPVEPSPQQEFSFDTPALAAATASSEVTETLKSIDESIKKLVSLFESKWQTN